MLILFFLFCFLDMMDSVSIISLTWMLFALRKYSWKCFLCAFISDSKASNVNILKVVTGKGPGGV